MSKDQNTPTFICEICVELSFLKFHHNNHCGHNICVTCLARHIQANVDANIANIKCPCCMHYLNPIKCQPLIPQKLFIKWCDRCCEVAISHFKKCYCPYYQSCSELILDECGESEALEKCVCPGCKRPFCYKCRLPWHVGNRCTQQMDSNDEKFLKLLKDKLWTRCPKCGQPVELRSGCSIVKCRCGTKFCHNCSSRSCKMACYRQSVGNICRNQDWRVYLIILLAYSLVVYVAYRSGLLSLIRGRLVVEIRNR